jgi:HEAT repeat protein
LTSLLLQKTGADAQRVKRLISRLGAAATGALLEALASEQDQSRRRRLFNLIASLGAVIVPDATRMLKDGRWYVVRNMIALLRKVGDKNSLPEVRKLTAHVDLRVRLEAIKTLLAFDPKLPRELLDKAIKDPDPKLAESAVVLVGQYGIQEAKDPLVSILMHWDLFGARRSLRIKTLRALADLADPAVLPRLGRFFKDSLFPPVALEERRAAFRSLEAYPVEARRPLVERGLRSKDPQIRDLCQRLAHAPAPPAPVADRTIVPGAQEPEQGP